MSSNERCRLFEHFLSTLIRLKVFETADARAVPLDYLLKYIY